MIIEFHGSVKTERAVAVGSSAVLSIICHLSPPLVIGDFPTTMLFEKTNSKPFVMGSRCENFGSKT
jgi:hypothetical protein